MMIAVLLLLKLSWSWTPVTVDASAAASGRPDPTASQRLYEDLFFHYRKELRPVRTDSQAVNVTMHLWLKQVLKVDEIDQILTVYCWVEEYWNDAYLQWNPAEYGGITALNIPTEKLWRPDILVYNNADMNVHENEVTTNAVLNYTGDVICFRAIITKITCNLDMTYFPFDQQTCAMMFASWSYDGSKVFVLPTNGERGNLQYYIENTEWKLLDFFYVRNIKYYDCCLDPYPDVTYYFVLERNPSYYILNLIIPSVFITVVTMVGFFTPYSSTGENTEKVSLGVTALLSLAIILLMVADKMPATSKVIPLIGKYYIGLIWLIFMATIVTTITLRIQSRGNAGKSLSPKVRNFFFGWVAKLLLIRLDISTKHKETDDVTRSSSNKPKISCSYYSSSGYTETTLLLNTPKNGSVRFGGESAQNLAHTANNWTPPQNDNRFVNINNNHGRHQSQDDSGSGSDPMENKEVIVLLGKIRKTLAEFDRRMQEDEKLAEVRKEYEQLSRICERLLMVTFVVITVLFATLMLHSHEANRMPSNL